MKRVFALIILAAVLLAASCSKESLHTAGTGSSAAGQGSDARTEQTGYGEAVEVISREISFNGRTCEYSDDWFTFPSDRFMKGLALQSCALAESTANSPRGNDYSNADSKLASFMSAAGFEGYYATESYRKKPTADSIAAGFARKTVGGRTLIAVAVRSLGYEREWASNFDVGDEGDHHGFSKSARTVVGELSDYIVREGISGDVSFWICGYSRGAAVANLAAAYAVDRKLSKDALDAVSYDCKNVYAYCFETPMPSVADDRGAERYSGIFNLIVPGDVVCFVAPGFWGFGRYGTDVYLPSPMDGGGADGEPFSVMTVGYLSRDIIESKKYVNYNFEVFAGDFAGFMAECVPTRAEYFAESETICEFIGAALGGCLDTAWLPAADGVSGRDALDFIAAFGMGNDDDIRAAFRRLTGGAIKDGYTERVITDAAVAFSHLFRESITHDITALVTMALNTGSVAYFHLISTCRELLAATDGFRTEADYALIEFNVDGTVRVSVDGEEAAELDGKYRTVAPVDSPLPYSVTDGGKIRVFLPRGIQSVEVCVTARESAEGQTAVIKRRDCAGKETAVGTVTFSAEPGETFVFTVQNPCFGG